MTPLPAPGPDLGARNRRVRNLLLAALALLFAFTVAWVSLSGSGG